jgi:hypothetical protein
MKQLTEMYVAILSRTHRTAIIAVFVPIHPVKLWYSDPEPWTLRDEKQVILQCAHRIFSQPTNPGISSTRSETVKFVNVYEIVPDPEPFPRSHALSQDSDLQWQWSKQPILGYVGFLLCNVINLMIKFRNRDEASVKLILNDGK